MSNAAPSPEAFATKQGPHSVRLNGRARAMRLVAPLVALGIAIVVCFLSIRDLGELGALASKGVPVEARIDRKTGGSGKSMDLVFFTFQHAGRQLSGKENVDREDWKRMQVGDSLVVTVHDKDPKLLRIGQVDDTRVSQAQSFWLTLWLSMTVMVGIMGAVFEAQIQGDLAVLREFTTVPGKATKVLDATSSSRPGSYEVAFSYRTPDGDEGTGRSWVSATVADRLAIDSALVVMIDPEKKRPPQLAVASRFAEFDSA